MSNVVPALAPVPAPDLRDIEQFLFLEARLLDEKRLPEWRDLFTEDGLYWAPTRHDQATPDDCVSLFFDDRAQMAARIRRLASPDPHVQQPVSHTVHLVTNVEIDPVPPDGGGWTVHSAFTVEEYRHTEPRRYAGRYS